MIVKKFPENFLELGYDKTTSVANGNTYLTPEYNGNIEGISWKSAGCGINRKYDFTYDDVNRLSTAAYLQNTTGSSWDKTQIDFSVSNLSYDANGNILTLNQNGFTVGGSGAIDQLTYAYQANSNKLSQVTDAANNPTTLLGDFHYSGTKGSYDYLYDGNGNLDLDNNKGISSINYNFLNLPQLIHINAKGNITYTYDASGNKLSKVTADSTIRHSTTTLYIGPFVYQQSDTITNPTGGTDTLQFISHEEGRTRWAYHKYTTGTSAYKFEYDFFEKDHLGNTRILLTQQKDTAQYLATLEAAYRTTESQIFGNISATSYPWKSLPGYGSLNLTTITNPNDSVSRVDYTGTSGQKTGPNLLLKVMSGDTLKIAVQSFYNTNSITTTNSSFNDVLTSLATGLVNTTGGAHGNAGQLEGSSSSVYTGITTFLSNDDPAPPSGYPKAYLNWIFLDDQFNYVSSLSGAVAAASSTYPAATLNTVAPGSQLIANKNGYLYIWVSNETQGWDVFFDNLSVQYRQGMVLEENQYYPFGLSMAGISDQAIKTNYAENFRKYNGIEYDSTFALDDYEAKFRNLDPQTGRWWQVDPEAENSREMFSPYSSMSDDPVFKNDPLGDEDAACCEGIFSWLVEKTAENQNGAAAVTLGVVSGVGNFAQGAINTIINPPDLSSTGVAKTAVQMGLDVNNRIDVIQNGSTVDKAAIITQTALDVVATVEGVRAGVGSMRDFPGIVYERIDKTGKIEKPYVGQAKNGERFEARQKEHARANPNSDFEFKKIDRGKPGKDLNKREQKALDRRGGPTNKSNPNGGTSNKKNVIAKKPI